MRRKAKSLKKIFQVNGAKGDPKCDGRINRDYLVKRGFIRGSLGGTVKVFDYY